MRVLFHLAPDRWHRDHPCLPGSSCQNGFWEKVLLFQISCEGVFTHAKAANVVTVSVHRHLRKLNVKAAVKQWNYNGTSTRNSGIFHFSALFSLKDVSVPDRRRIVQ